MPTTYARPSRAIPKYPLTVEEVLDAAARVVERYGEDHVYRYTDSNGDDICVYRARSGQPSCLVGHILVQLHRLPSLKDLTSGAPSHMGCEHNTATIRQLSQEGIIRGGVTNAAVMVLRQIQLVQDEHQSWGAALRAGHVTATTKLKREEARELKELAAQH
jgi:hypothetical protein